MMYVCVCVCGLPLRPSNWFSITLARVPLYCYQSSLIIRQVVSPEDNEVT